MHSDDGFVQLDDGTMHVVQDGRPGVPVLVLIHGTAGSTAWWDPVVPSLAEGHRVIRVDLLGHGRSADPTGGYEVPAQARRVGAALDRLGVNRVTAVVGHSSGGNVATALAEQRPELVASLALINTGPSPDAFIPQGRLGGLLMAPFPGRLLWRLLNGPIIRKGMRNAVTRPVGIPAAAIAAARAMSYRTVVETNREGLNYLVRQSIPARLAGLGTPVLVVFGTEDHRWRPAAFAAYRDVPGARVEALAGVGHSPMLEEPETTGALLLGFVAAEPRGVDR